MTDHSSPPPSSPQGPDLSDPADPTFDQYLAGRLSDVAHRDMERRVNTSPEWRGLVTLVRSWLGTIDSADPPDVEASVHRLSTRIEVSRQAASDVADRLAVDGTRGASIRARRDRRSPASAMSRPVLRYGIGACAAALVGVVAWSAWHRQWSIASRADARTYATAPMQRAAFDLPDGSHVVLAPVSRLRFESTASGARVVSLDGEAIFTVTHDVTRPFVVRTGATRTTVLGTRFDVRRYPTDHDVQVAVAEGRVSVATDKGNDPPMILAAGTVGRLTDSTAVVTSGDSAQQYLRWTSGQLVFHDVPAPDVLAAMTRWYGYRFRWADSTLAEHRLTTVLDAQSPSTALGTIKLLLNVDLTFDGDLVTLHPRRAPATPARDRRDPRIRLTTSSPEVGR